MKIATSSVIYLTALSFPSIVVLGQDENYLGDPTCIIDHEFICRDTARLHGLRFDESGDTSDNKKWGCFVDSDNVVKFDTSGSKDRIKVLPKNWEHKRLYCGGTQISRKLNPQSTSTDGPVTPGYGIRDALPTCFDYRQAFNVNGDECSWPSLFTQIKAVFEEQSKQDWALKWKCHGGLLRELKTLLNLEDDNNDWKSALNNVCANALSEASKVVPKDAGWLDSGINLDEFFEGQGFLNDEYGNLQQQTQEFIRRGGTDRYYYTGEDPRLNDYLPTSEQSYQGAVAINDFYSTTAKSKLLNAPSSFEDYKCDETNAVMCCWSKDRQYNDNNGSCGFGNCINQPPGDNTDLCWTEDSEGQVFPYPGNERPLHCHGFSWSSIPQGNGDVNNDAKWNNLFFVSMYDHLYKRGYVDSITDAQDFMGEQAMCGCVEDMAPVARADCTEAIGHSNFTMYQDAETGLLKIEYLPGTFEIEFRACEGYNYADNVTPEDYATKTAKEIGLQRKTNDLSAFIFRQYLEGKTDEGLIEKYEETVVGYRTPRVNNNDAEREKVCKAKFEAKFPGKEYTKVVVEEENA